MDPTPELPPPEDARQRLRRRLQRLPFYAFLLFAGFVGIEFVFPPGVRVYVINLQPTPLRDVAVTVGADTQAIEAIPPTEFAFVHFARLRGDFHVAVAYVNGEGKTIELDAGDHTNGWPIGTSHIHLRVKNDRLAPGSNEPLSSR